MKDSDEHTECCFDAYCKRLLKRETIDAAREYERQSNREIAFSNLSRGEEAQLQYMDEYSPNRHVFSTVGMEIEISSDELVEALTALSKDRRDIVLLAYLCDLTDADIAIQMGLCRSTVQYRRTSSLEQLRKLLVEE